MRDSQDSNHPADLFNQVMLLLGSNLFLRPWSFDRLWYLYVFHGSLSFDWNSWIKQNDGYRLEILKEKQTNKKNLVNLSSFCQDKSAEKTSCRKKTLNIFLLFFVYLMASTNGLQFLRAVRITVPITSATPPISYFQHKIWTLMSISMFQSAFESSKINGVDFPYLLDRNFLNLSSISIFWILMKNESSDVNEMLRILNGWKKN